MDIINKAKKELVSKFNMSSDYDILIMLDGRELTIDEKKYLIENCQARINQMNIDIFLQMIRQTDQKFCKECNHYLSSKIRLLTVSQTEELLYVNKHYHEVSKVADFLVEQDWFQAKKEMEYKTFFIAYELEKMLKKGLVDKETIVDYGTDIISLLTLNDSNFMVVDMIIKNYLSLLEKYNQHYFETFKKTGYEIINQQIASDRELTPNMIIFDCSISKIELKSNVDYFEFYEKEDDEALAYAHAGIVRINLSAIKDIYKRYENKKIGTQMIFYIIGHEIDHIFCQKYQSDMSNDSVEELRIFNSCISLALQQIVTRTFYLEYHNCFSHEFSANIKGIENLYHKQKYLSSITKEDKEEMNRLLANVLFSSYCLVADESTEYGYVGPVEFSREKFKKFKDKLPGYACQCLLDNQKDLSDELEMLENNLGEMEKFLFGYYNVYIGILKLVANGKVSTVDLFEELPVLNDKYKRLIGEEFPPYLPSYNEIKKKQ